MQQKTAPIIIAISLAVLILGGAVVWYVQNKDIIQPDFVKITPQNQDLAATLAYQQGEVQVRVAGSDWQPVETDTVLHSGDSLKTGQDSKAIIEVENGDKIRAGFNTEIFLTSLNKQNVTITQISGASYSRVAKNLSRVYEVKSGEVTIQALGTAFDTIQSEEAVDVNVVESNVKVLTEKDEAEVAEGKTATVEEGKDDISVDDIDQKNLTNDWYTWNKEEDSKSTDKLGVLEEYAGPSLTISSPTSGTHLTSNSVTVSGTVGDPNAKLEINGHEVTNDNGQFTTEVSLVANKNTITVTAENSEGLKTIKEIKVFYDVQASATPLKLEAATEDDGVHLSWNESTSPAFLYYKIVRSEDNANLKYPDDGYISKQDKGQASYVDTDVSADQTYYYRVCEVMSGDKVFCSNVAHMKGKNPPAANINVNNETDNEDEEETGIKMTGEAKDDGVHLSWEVINLTITSGFKVIMGENANPVYPGNDFKYLTDNAVRSYTWAVTDGKRYHFRVCQYDGNGKCLVYSNNVSVTAKSIAAQYSGPNLSAQAGEDGVGLWWGDRSNIPGFKYYKVVRSETNPNLKYPDDGYITVRGKGEESYRDYTSVKGKTYYYRICAVGDQIYCGNVEQVTATNENTAPVAVSLSGSFADEKMTLTWTASAEKDFKYYKIVWSQTKSAPVYPADGYLTPISEKTTVTYTDEGDKTGTRAAEVDLSTGTHYYSICVVDQVDQVACSNTVTLLNGVVQ